MAMSGDTMPARPSPPAWSSDAGLVTAADLQAQIGFGGAKSTDATTPVTQAERYRALAIEMINGYLGDDAAAAVPVAVINECIIRIAGYGYESFGARIIEESIGPMTRKYADDRVRSFFKRSGAESLLSPYKERGAGIIE